MDGTRILVVDDERIVALDLAKSLDKLGYKVCGTVSSGEEAILKAGELRPDLVLMDIQLKGDIDGTEAARQIVEMFSIPIIYLTAYSDKITLARAKLSQPFGFLIKPFVDRELHTTIEVALYKHNVERELKEAKLAAESASRAKNTFLATMSHEIRTPLNGIIGLTNIAMETELNEEQQDLLAMVKESAHSLLGVLNDILDFSRIESGKLRLFEEQFDIGRVMENTCRTLAYQAERKNLKLGWSIDDDVPKQLYGDSVRLKQVLYNLVGNGIKFTETGDVHVAVSLSGELGDTVQLSVAVRDTGIGIPEDRLSDIFSSFTQLEDYMTRNHGGAGLGLAISYKLVEMLGGSLAVTSVPGKGSIFTFTANFQRRAPKVEKEVSTVLAKYAGSRKQPITILVAEDNTTSRKLLIRLLEKQGVTVVSAKNGREVLECDPGKRIDMLLMDIQMPDLDGIEATRSIRNNEVPGIMAETPILAVTAHALKGDRERFLAMGFNGYLPKPVKADDLYRTITDVLCAMDNGGACPKPVESPGSNESHIDVLGTLDRMAGDEELLEEIWRTFLDDTPRKLDQAILAAENGQFETVQLVAHALKGAADNVGAFRARDAADAVCSCINDKALDQILEQSRTMSTVFWSGMREIKQLLAERSRSEVA